MQAPYIKPEILEWLEEEFPNDFPSDMLDDPRQYDVLVGQQQVVRRVRREIRRQAENFGDVV